MLQIPDLDDITYEQLLQGAIHKIPLLTKEWTDFNRHDPGITTLETYAWLADMLNYYMNATGNVHILKYMKLLGITELPGCASQAWVCVETDEEEITLTEGFPIYAGNKCFVCENTTTVAQNRFCLLLYETDGRISDLTSFAGEDGSYARVFPAGSRKEESLYLGFEKALKEDARIFVTIREYPQRSGIPDDFSLSTLKAECFDGKRWVPVEMISDRTNGLLRSGVMTFHIPFVMSAYSAEGVPEGFYLKLTVTDNHYDIAPEIGKIFTDPVKMIQKKEWGKRLSHRYAGEPFAYGTMHYVSPDDQIMVGVCVDEKLGYYRIVNSFQEESGEVFVDYENNLLTFSKESQPEEGCLVDVFLVKESMLANFEAGITDGCANQQIPFFVKDPYEVHILLAEEKEDGAYYQHWDYVPSLEQASYEDRVFTYDRESNSLMFGDGIHGMVPESGRIVCISECSLSDYEEGNVRAGEIKRVEDFRAGEFRAYNTAMATGARGMDSIEKMQERLESKVMEQNRVVSPSDYENLIRNIPGLMIRGAKVVSAKEYCKNHGIAYKPYDTYVVVCPRSMKPKEKLGTKYHDYICNYLEQYRMLNTRVKVVGPVFGCVNVSGRIRIIGKSYEVKERVEKFLRDYIEKRQKDCCFGAELSYGDIFMQLENLDDVACVEELHLSMGSEMGRKSDKGDIILNSDCLPYVGELEFEYKE